MAFKKQKESPSIILLLKIILIGIPMIETTNIDCKGKAFHCFNSTHFKICVDFGGVSKTVDDFLIPCPPSTACTDNNYYECEYQIPTTSAVDIQSDATNELSESTVSSPWELFEVTTFFPLNNNERSVELTESSTIPPAVTISEAEDTETAHLHYSLVNDVQNEVITENVLYKTTVSDLSESENNSMHDDVISSTKITAMDGILDYLNTTISHSAVNVDNYSTTERVISGDIKTTALNNVEELGFVGTTLLSSAMTDNLSTNRTAEKATTEKHTSTKNEIAIDLYEPVITLTNNLENESLPSTISDNLSTSETAELATTDKYTSTKSEIAIDLYEPVITKPTNNFENENLPSTTTDNLSTSETAEKTTTKKYTGTKTEIGVHLYEPVTTIFKNNKEHEDLPSTITDNLSTNRRTEEATTEKYTSTKSEIAIDLYEPVITTLTNNLENESLPSTISDNLSTSETAELATTDKYTSTKSEIAIDLYEPVITKLTNNLENENFPSTTTTTDSLNTSEIAEKATTKKYTGTKTETCVDLYEPVPTTFKNNKEHEDLPSTITDNLSTNRRTEEATTEKYTSTKSEIAIDLYEPVITTLTNNLENESLPSTISDNLSTSETAELATTDKYTSTKSEIAIDLYEPVITKLTNNLENENLPSTTTTDSLNTSEIAEKATTKKYTSTKTETGVDLYEPVPTTFKNNKEHEDLPSTITDNLSTNRRTEEATTEKYTSTKSEIAIDLYEPVITTLTNNLENESLPSTISDNLSTSETAELATTDKYTSTKSEIAIDLYEPVITKLTNNLENENLPSTTTTDSLNTSEVAEKATTKKYTGTKTETGVDLYEPVQTTFKNNKENEYLLSTITDNLSTNRIAAEATTEKYTSTNSEIAIDLYEPVITKLTNNLKNENLPSITTDSLSISEIAEKATTKKYTGTKTEIGVDLYEPVTTFKNNKENEYLPLTTTDNLSTNRIAAEATTEKYTSTNSEIVVDLYESAITTLTNNIENEDFPSTITDNLSKKRPAETAIAEKYTSTNNEIAVHLYESAITTLMNNIEKEDFHSTKLSSAMTENINTNISSAAVTTPNYSGNNSEILITTSNYLDNAYFTTTTLNSSVIKEKFTNNENSEINSNGTFETYLVNTQVSTAKDVNLPTATQAYGTFLNKIDEISSYSKIADSLQTESPMMTENIALNNTLEGYSIKQKDFSSVTRAASLSIENIYTSDSTKTNAENKRQDMKVKDFNQPTTEASILDQKNPNNKENIHSRIDYIFTTGYSPVKTESNSNTENINNSLPDAITFPVRFDLVNVQQDTAKKDVNFPTTINDSYRNAAINFSQIDNTSMYETPTSNADLPFNSESDIELQFRTDVNLTLKDTTEEISAEEQNDIGILVTKSAISAMDSTNSYKTNLSTVNEIEVHTNITTKTSNDTAEEILIHKKDILNNEINDITSPLPPNVDFINKAFLTTNSDEISLTTVDVDLNDQVEEFLIKENYHLPLSVNSESSLVTEIIMKNLSLLSDLIVTTESYNANSQQNITVANLQFSTSSSSDETIGYQPNNQNSKETESLTHEFFETTDEYGSKQNLKKQRYDYDDNSGSISTASMFTSFAKPEYNVKLSDSFINLTTKQTTNIDKNLSNIQLISYDSTYSEIDSNGTLINSTVKEISKNNSDNNMHSSQNNSEYSFNLFNITNTEYDVTKPKNSSKVATNIENLDNATVSKNFSTSLILSANIYKEIKTTNDESTRNSVKSGGLNIHEASNTYSTTYMLKNKTFFNNISEDLENLLRNDQNNSNYKMISNKTIKDSIDINAWSINKNKPINMTENQEKRKEQNNRTTKITTKVELNNSNSSKGYERTIIKFDCKNRHRGKYSDRNDCQKFYICIGMSEPILGKCPKNTVFSEITKQCTKNLSHCIRNNQFQCPAAGRFIDIFSDQFYFICAKNVEGYIRFKLICQKGYYLDKSKLQCTLDSLDESMSNEDISETDRERSTIESKSKEKNDSKNQKDNFKLKCQKGYHLDKSKVKCILDSLNGSSSNEEISKTDSDKSTTESKSKDERDSKNRKNEFECKKEGKFVYPDDFRKYYQCTKNGKSEFRRKIKKCDTDEIFHSVKRKCVGDDSYDSNE